MNSIVYQLQLLLVAILNFLTEAFQVLTDYFPNDLGLESLLSLNAIGAAIGVLAIQTHASVILRRRVELASRGLREHDRSHARLMKLVFSLMLVQVLCCVSIIVLLFQDDQALPARELVLLSPGQNGATEVVRFSSLKVGAAITAVAMAVAAWAFARYWILEFVWPWGRGATSNLP